MADKDVQDKKVAGAEYSNAREVYRVVYDFSEDGGATTDDYMLLEAGGDIVIHDYYMKVLVECDSAGDGASLDVGVDGGDEDVLVDGVAEASLAAGALIQPTIVEGAPNVMPMPLKLADGGKILMRIQGEALTAGKVEHYFLISKY